MVLKQLITIEANEVRKYWVQPVVMFSDHDDLFSVERLPKAKFFHGTPVNCALQVINSGGKLMALYGAGSVTNPDFTGRSRANDGLKETEQYGSDFYTACGYTYPLLVRGRRSRASALMRIATPPPSDGARAVG